MSAASSDAIRLRLVESIESEPVDELAARAVRRAAAAVAALGDVDLFASGCVELRSVARRDRRTPPIGRCRRGRPQLVRWIAATRSGGQGFFSAKTVVKHMCKLSGPEAHRRVQTARLHNALPDWAAAEADGRVGVAQSELMARIAANPRIESAVLERDSPALLDDAIEQSFDEFERRARTWEALADPAGDLAENERQQANRDVMLRPRPDGGWTLTGNLPELGRRRVHGDLLPLRRGRMGSGLGRGPTPPRR